ncbi:DUF4436 family protein [bacterium]|nr:DUF4436 family protein [bacterium]
MSNPRRWLLLSIILLLVGATGLIYAAWIRQITDEPQESNLFIDLPKKELRYANQTAHLTGSPFYYPRDRYLALLTNVNAAPKASGYKVQATLTKEGTLVEIERSDLVQFEAHTIVALLWLISLGTAAVALKTVLTENSPDPALLTYNAVVLFALPALRQTMAGAPAVGIYIDFYGFLCCEVIAVVSLSALTVSWLARKARS